MLSVLQTFRALGSVQ